MDVLCKTGTYNKYIFRYIDDVFWFGVAIDRGMITRDFFSISH